MKWCVLLLALCLSGLKSEATPYASGVTLIGTAVTFYLNESADSVTVELDGGVSTLNLGAKARGFHTFDIGEAFTFEIVVTKAGGNGYLQGVTNLVSSDTNVLLRFPNPRGVAVNKNPGSPLFGRFYVSNAQSGTTTTGSRPVGTGLYALNPDQTDALGQGNTARNGGITFLGTPETESPHRLAVGEDNVLFVCDLSTAHGGLYQTDANLDEGTSLLGGTNFGVFPVGVEGQHGSISAVYPIGSIYQGNLRVYVMDEDLQINHTTATQTERNSLWSWNIGAVGGSTNVTKIAGGGASTGYPIGFAAQLTDMTRSPTSGRFYITQRRANGGESGLWVRQSEGEGVWNSLPISRAILGSSTNVDILTESVAVDLSPDEKVLAVLRRDNAVFILPLIDGIPDLTNRVILTNSPNTAAARDVAFDAAGNLYVLSSGHQQLRIYSPGGVTVTRTRSDGTFSAATITLPKVSVGVNDDLASEAGPDTGSFILTRAGATTTDLTVEYTLSGTASNGVDYQTLSGSVVIPAGQNTANVILTPLADGVSEWTETVTLTLKNTTNYLNGLVASATAVIADGDIPTISISAADSSAYERVSGEYVVFSLTRTGRTNEDLFLNMSFAGSAIPDVDYTAQPPVLNVPAGVTNYSLVIPVIGDNAVEGNETIIAQLLAGVGDYERTAQITATATIVDDDVVENASVFRDDFETDSSPDWITYFGANNNIFDATVTWAFDYGTLGIPAAPHSTNGTTLGLYAQVNKNNATAAGAAGLNFYPRGQSFSGNYALRFDMFLNYGATFSTEHVMAGLNHSSSLTNRLSQNATDTSNNTRGGDGIWASIETDGSANIEWGVYTYTNVDTFPYLVTNVPASAVSNVFGNPAYSANGSPGNLAGFANRSWTEIELEQKDGRITLRANQQVIWSITNTYGFTAGDIMLGLSDQFDSVGTASNFVIFDNVRVVSAAIVTPATITMAQPRLSGGILELDFTSSSGGSPGDYHLEVSDSLIPSNWSTDNGATITAILSGFRATTGASGTPRFYRIRK